TPVACKYCHPRGTDQRGVSQSKRHMAKKKTLTKEDSSSWSQPSSDRKQSNAKRRPSPRKVSQARLPLGLPRGRGHSQAGNRPLLTSTVVRPRRSLNHSKPTARIP